MGPLNWRVRGLELALNEPEERLRDQAAQSLGIDPGEVRSLRIARKAVDARRKGATRRLRFVIQVDVVLQRPPNGDRFHAARRAGRVAETPPARPLELPRAELERPAGRCVVVGAGPAGLYCALTLALNGVAVDLIDRGPSLDERGTDLVRFHRTRTPNRESNLLFGEGGAGTYSDGKLYTRVDDPIELACLDELVACGAPEAIRYDARAHIGTDKLHRILPRFRQRLIDLGVRFHWRTRLTGLQRDAEQVRGIETTSGPLECRALFLAPGHSARDTLRQLQAQGLHVEAKPFQIGVRIEHPQQLIDAGRWGRGPEAELLGPASYNLVCKAGPEGPSAYSFCMCPGGKIVASVNHPETVCTNGMSNSMHSSPWANAAIVTTYGPAEYGDGALAGLELQERLERRFFEAGGGDYTAPAQRADDFLAGRVTRRPRRSSYTFGEAAVRIDALLPEALRDALRRALLRFDRQIPGFAGPEGLLVGIESRSSGPVRLTRDAQSGVALGFDNLYPIGEGAGYAGGIMSAAIDGARAAQRYLRPR